MIGNLCQIYTKGIRMTNSGAYVGRVGGLAVALGIGAAIATGQGVAWADSTEPPGSSASPEPPPSSSGAPAAGGPAAASPGSSIERKRLSVPSARPWDRQDRQARRKALVGKIESRLNPNLSTQAETKPEEKNGEPHDTTAATPGPETAAPAGGGSEALHQAAGDPAVKPTVTPEGPPETNDGAAGILRNHPSLAAAFATRDSQHP